MAQTDQQNDNQKLVRPADRSVWLIWLGMVLLAVAILPFAVRNSEIVRQIAAMCGFTLNKSALRRIFLMSILRFLVAICR